MFSQVSVCLQGGVCPIACWDISPRPEADTRLAIHPPGQTPPGQIPPGKTPPGQDADTPPMQCMLGYSQQVGGTHPTGMHSCFFHLCAYLCKI